MPHPPPLIEAGILLLAGLVGGSLPLLVRWNERQLHASLALSTGIFLGAVFFHLLPSIGAEAAVHVTEEAHHEAGEELAEGVAAGEHESPEAETDHAHPALLPWVFVLIGILGVYLVEALALRSLDSDDLHRHRAVSFAALTGLSLHAFTAGVCYPAASEVALRAIPFMAAFVLHKALEAFSLTTVFALGEFPRRRILVMVALFSLVTPVGILIGSMLTENLEPSETTIFSALAAGTFLYVSLCELLPEVFHHREDSLAKVGLLALGIGLVLLLHGAGG